MYVEFLRNDISNHLGKVAKLSLLSINKKIKTDLSSTS